MNYIDRLIEIRNDRDIKQSTIAEILGVKQSAVSKYEKRRTQYTVDDIIKLCNFYKISADYILGLPENLEFPKRD